ncbi:hypothetical protein GDO86_009324 [Hymenochirus boettgeri]|uniref:MARVEL domain-containing protein n=1 Tax=Hymenochirus boettgeri TaxID=247094 RepID=A0A8T2JII1_9PIPI|nr:hypothetical protein GDO86_009324 [Hymenochirus boettgeri]
MVSYRETDSILVMIIGGLVWILVASARVVVPLLQGWVMFVSVACFTFTLILLFLYCSGAHGGKCVWIIVDTVYHCIAALFYLSAAVLQPYATILLLGLGRIYQINVAATVFAFVATALYVIHAILSLIRWKRST